MKRLIHLLTVMAVTAACLSKTNDVFARGGNDNRPFKGTAEGQVVDFLPPTMPGDPALLIIEYTGEASHLGRFTRTEYLFLNPDGFTFSGFMVFTAANGDELHLDFAGMFVSLTDVVGSYEFTGGTGRFDDATGTADFSGYTPNGFDVSVSFRGRIGY